MPVRTWSWRAVAVSLFVLLAACGGNASSVSTGPGTGEVVPPPVVETIQGIATPESVSVVTATNTGT
jgi:hypothetical protein